MRFFRNQMGSLLLLLSVMVAPLANAHLMVAQHGTLNFLNDDVFMVLSVPMSAFKGIDTNGDGKVTMIEFNHHREAISKTVKDNVRLTDNKSVLELKGLMLSPVVHHHGTTQAITQLALMGKFKLTTNMKKTPVLSQLTFQVNLFGSSKKETKLEITATNKVGNQKHTFELTPTLNIARVFE